MTMFEVWVAVLCRRGLILYALYITWDQYNAGKKNVVRSLRIVKCGLSWCLDNIGTPGNDFIKIYGWNSDGFVILDTQLFTRIPEIASVCFRT